MEGNICVLLLKIFPINISINSRRFICLELSNRLARIFYFSIERRNRCARRGKTFKFYSIPSFRRYRIQANLYSVGDSRGKPEGPNIIRGTRGSRYAWDLTCIHFPNRRVNVKNTARVFSRRVGLKKKKTKKRIVMKMLEEFVALKSRSFNNFFYIFVETFFHIWKWIFNDNSEYTIIQRIKE